MRKKEKSSSPPRICPNCDGPVPRERPLFCGPRCEQTASLVRYARRKIAEGTYKRPDIAEAIQIRAAILAGWYYDERERRVAPETRQELLTRSGGRCGKCGCIFAPEGDARFTVQHIETDAGMLLAAWCYRCNIADAQSHLKPAAGEELAFLRSLQDRIHAPQPRRPCDDPDRWPAMSRELRGLGATAQRARARNGTDWLTPEQRRRVRDLFVTQTPIYEDGEQVGCWVAPFFDEGVEIRGHWLGSYSVAMKWLKSLPPEEREAVIAEIESEAELLNDTEPDIFEMTGVEPSDGIFCALDVLSRWNSD
jgi:hypothetical protein